MKATPAASTTGGRTPATAVPNRICTTSSRSANCPPRGGSTRVAGQRLGVFGGRRRRTAPVVRVFGDEDEEATTGEVPPSQSENSNLTAAPDRPSPASLARTLSDLDAILGVEDEEEEQQDKRDEALKVEFNPDILKKIAQADGKSPTSADGGGGYFGEGAKGSETDDGAKDKEAEKVKSAAEQISKIVSEVRQGGEKSSEESLRKEFDKLVELLKPEEMSNTVSREDCKVMKERVFGAETFWVTEIVQNDDIIGGMLFKGNLRGEVDAVYEKVETEIKRLFPDKYEVLAIEEPDAEDFEDLKGRERIAFLLLPAQVAKPPSTTRGQYVVSLLLATIGALSCLQVGIGAELSMVPQEIIDATLKSGTAENQESLQGLLAGWDPKPLIQAAWPIGAAIFGAEIAHDIGHRVVAASKGLKLGPSFIIPNGQIGLFGSITQYKSLCKNRADMFDVAYGGLAASGAVASALFLSGLILSMDQGAESLVPVPSVLFQGSVLLGTLAKTFVGSAAMAKSQVMVHPNLIAGWCSLVCTALNALPVGSLDGGRIVQAAYGKRALSISAILTYAGLGFGLLGSTLSLPFGLYVLFCQRVPEQYLKNHVTGVNTNRALFGAAVLIFAVATLLPMAPTDLDILQATI